MFKKLLTIVLVLLLFVSCSIYLSRNKETDKPVNPGTTVVSDDYRYYFDKLLNYEVHDKEVCASEDNAEFEELLDEMFKYFISQDYLGMHFKVKDYRAYSIEKPEVSFGDLKYGVDEESLNKEIEFLNRMTSFDFDKLSSRQQYDYECMEYSFYEDISSAYFSKYSKILTDSNCLPENIFSNLCDLTFYDEESVEDYLLLLKDVDRVMKDAITYTDEQQADGVYLLDSNIDYTKRAVEGVLKNKENNPLIVTFDERIDAADFIDNDKKETYKAANRDLVINEVLPAYERFLPELDKYYGKMKPEDALLCNINKDYARLNIVLNSSNTREVDDIRDILVNTINYFEITTIGFLMDDEAYNSLWEIEEDPTLPFTLETKDALEFLRLNAYKYYPELGDTEYDAKVLDPDTAPESAIAYYYQAPIDDSNQNVIRINPNKIGGGTASYITLAHEGFPGHLFQHVYQQRNNQNKVHEVIGFTGFVEGFAVYASRDAMLYSGISEDLADASFWLNEYYFPLYSLVDILANYYGMNVDQINDYMNENVYLNYFGEDGVSGLYDFVVAMPGTYQRYGVGFSELVNYRIVVEDTMGSMFDPAEYNEMLIKDGDTPFVILNAKFNDFLEGHVN